MKVRLEVARRCLWMNFYKANDARTRTFAVAISVLTYRDLLYIEWVRPRQMRRHFRIPLPRRKKRA